MPEDTTITCPHCGVLEEPDLGWQVIADGRKQLRAECRACGRWVKYMPQRDDDGSPSIWVRMAPQP